MLSAVATTGCYNAGMVESPTKRRRWFQFRLRTLLLLMVALGVAARWWGEPIFKARRQAKAAEAIRAAGGTVYYDEKATIPAWMTKFFGPDFGKPVDRITFLKGKKLDAELLPEMPALRTLELDDTIFTDADMAPLAPVRTSFTCRSTGPKSPTPG